LREIVTSISELASEAIIVFMGLAIAVRGDSIEKLSGLLVGDGKI